MKQVLISIICCFLLHISLNLNAQTGSSIDTPPAPTKKDNVKVKKKSGSSETNSMVKPAVFNLDEIKQHITKTNKILSTALVNGDSATIANIFHSQTIIYPANLPSMNSGSEMGSIAILLPAMGIKNMEIKSTDIFGNEEMVVETGTYSLNDATKQIDSGRYIVVWKKDEGKWKIYRDIWNSDGMTSKQ